MKIWNFLTQTGSNINNFIQYFARESEIIVQFSN